MPHARERASKSPQRAPDALPLATNLGYRVSYLSVLLNRAISPVLAVHGITNQQWRVISVLSEVSPVTAQEVTRWVTLDKAAVSRAVRQLVDLGLIERRLHAADARHVPLHLTARGATVHRKVAREVAAMQEELLRAVRPGDTDTLFEVMRQLEEGLRLRLHDAEA